MLSSKTQNRYAIKHNLNYYLLFIFVSIFFASCSDDPDTPAETPSFKVGKHGAFAICEGSASMDNATITRIDFETGSFSANYFSEANNGQLLGNTGQDIIIVDTFVVSTISGTGTVELFSLNTGKVIGRIILPTGIMPRYLAKTNDGVVYFTAYNSNNHHSFLYKFNPKTFSSQENGLAELNLGDGAYPEGIVFDGSSKLYIANSGYGDFGPNTDKSSTVSIVDINSFSEIGNFKTIVNPTLIQYTNNKIYVGNNSYNDPTLCRITEYDANNYNEIRHWISYNSRLCISKTGDTLFYLNGNYDATDTHRGLNYINLKDNSAESVLLLANTGFDAWYSLSINYDRNEIWIGNGFNYQIAGEINIYNYSNMNLLNTYKTGILPSAIKFY
jgi:hypothetical protein